MVTFLQQCIPVNINKVIIKLIQGRVVTQTLAGGLAIHLIAANLLQSTCTKITF